MIPSDWIGQAARRLQGRIERTPLTYDPDFHLYIKWENRQITGSFKIRGALNKLMSLERWELERGLVTASAGNHGQGVAIAARLAGASVRIFASEHAVPSKIAAMQTLGAQVELVPGGYADAEKAALAYASQHQVTWISPYNDPQVIAGQGTIGLELIEQVQEITHQPFPNCAVIVPVGGGGLVSGIGLALDSAATGRRPNPAKLVAVQSEASAYLHNLFHHGTQDETIESESLADGLAGAVEPMSITIPVIKRYVDAFVLVSEEQIAQAIAFAWERYREKIEGAAAAALAAALTGKVKDSPAVVIISGGNIQPEVHERVCALWWDYWKEVRKQ